MRCGHCISGCYDCTSAKHVDIIVGPFAQKTHRRVFIDLCFCAADNAWLMHIEQRQIIMNCCVSSQTLFIELTHLFAPAALACFYCVHIAMEVAAAIGRKRGQF